MCKGGWRRNVLGGKMGVRKSVDGKGRERKEKGGMVFYVGRRVRVLSLKSRRER